MQKTLRECSRLCLERRLIAAALSRHMRSWILWWRCVAGKTVRYANTANLLKCRIAMQRLAFSWQHWRLEAPRAWQLRLFEELATVHWTRHVMRRVLYQMNTKGTLHSPVGTIAIRHLPTLAQLHARRIATQHILGVWKRSCAAKRYLEHRTFLMLARYAERTIVKGLRHWQSTARNAMTLNQIVQVAIVHNETQAVKCALAAWVVHKEVHFIINRGMAHQTTQIMLSTLKQWRCVVHIAQPSETRNENRRIKIRLLKLQQALQLWRSFSLQGRSILAHLISTQQAFLQRSWSSWTTQGKTNCRETATIRIADAMACEGKVRVSLVVWQEHADFQRKARLINNISKVAHSSMSLSRAIRYWRLAHRPSKRWESEAGAITVVGQHHQTRLHNSCNASLDLLFCFAAHGMQKQQASAQQRLRTVRNALHCLEVHYQHKAAQLVLANNTSAMCDRAAARWQRSALTTAWTSWLDQTKLNSLLMAVDDQISSLNEKEGIQVSNLDSWERQNLAAALLALRLQPHADHGSSPSSRRGPLIGQARQQVLEAFLKLRIYSSNIRSRSHGRSHSRRYTRSYSYRKPTNRHSRRPMHDATPRLQQEANQSPSESLYSESSQTPRTIDRFMQNKVHMPIMAQALAHWRAGMPQLQITNRIDSIPRYGSLKWSVSISSNQSISERLQHIRKKAAQKQARHTAVRHAAKAFSEWKELVLEADMEFTYIAIQHFRAKQQKLALEYWQTCLTFRGLHTRDMDVPQLNVPFQ